MNKETLSTAGNANNAPLAAPIYRLAVDRRANLSYEEFVRDYLKPNKPVVITDALKNWKALRRWTLEFFKTRYADQEVQIDGKPYTMKSFIELVEQSGPGKVAPYLRNRILKDIFPDLMTDLEPMPPYFIPNWLSGPLFPSKGSEIEIYIGGAGGSFPYLHYDGNYYYAFLCQLLGRKEFVLYGPDQTPYMYPKPEHHRNHSQIDNCLNPDFQKYPLFAKAEGMKFSADAGEIVFIPGGWWHTARMLSASITVSMNSANSANWKEVTGDVCYKAGLKNPLLAAAIRIYLLGVGMYKASLDYLVSMV